MCGAYMCGHGVGVIVWQMVAQCWSVVPGVCLCVGPMCVRVYVWGWEWDNFGQLDNPFKQNKKRIEKPIRK